ncbi:MAG TPA: VOC family protein [Methanocella sp.]|uniref:VOC family protein n=1 Tax=Methanocella sp. TaxID=2052833 RepID=UPI002C9E224A|nr:VOC family protein [Methanocella sp.]HTY90499.1 VOC family protein [Methanocella sp.]
MIERISHVTVLVRDYDEALDFYTNKLGFEKAEDSKMPSGDRWLTVSPKQGRDVQIVLQKPGKATFGDLTEEMLGRIGQGTAWAFKVDDCKKTCDELAKRGVKILSPPQDFGFAIEAMFADLYGNPYILMQPPAGRK